MTRAARRSLAAAWLLAVPLPMAAQAANGTSWDDRVSLARQHRVAQIRERRFTHAQFWDAVSPALLSPRLVTTEVGRSLQGRALRTVTFGTGPVSVLLWSQMHGNESTATMALADVFAFLASSASSVLRDRVASRLTVTILPMLNPDGAEIFQRENAAGIDINRDARQLATPEARALKAVRDRLEPAFGFNLHDQNARTRAGEGPQAAIALLAPPADAERSYPPGRRRARLVASWLASDFAHAVEGRIARYDDTFNPRAFGDLMQAWGTSTVLIESGALPDDPEKQSLRLWHAAALLGVLEAIALETYESPGPDAYERLPFNRGGAYDVLITGGSLVVPGAGAVRADVAVNYEDPVARTGGVIREVGDLTAAVAIDTVDATGRFLHPAPGSVRRVRGRAWVPLGAPAGFIVRAGADARSKEVDRIP